MDRMNDLVALARAARERAYAPYSGYPVGAAIEAPDGQTWTGVNVENVSYGGTICAERSALVALVGEGHREFRRLAVVTRDGGTPCGICLQALLEFAPDPSQAEILVAGDEGAVTAYRLSDLIPRGFRSLEVMRTENAS